MTAKSVAFANPPVPNVAVLGRLFAGGLAGLLIWEIWSHFVTPPIAGFPLEPPALVATLIARWTGVQVSSLTATSIHYAVGIFGYPIAYWIVSRALRSWGAVFDIAVWVIFTAYVAWLAANGNATMFIGLFWILVTGLTATRITNGNALWADSLSWGNFTWFNALGIMAPLAGQPFLLLSDQPRLSFMSWAGHVIYGAIAVYVFERLQARGADQA
jgi:hypothetical protein